MAQLHGGESTCLRSDPLPTAMTYHSVSPSLEPDPWRVRPVVGFSFPYGFFDDAAVAAIGEARYRCACVTDSYTRAGPLTRPRFYVGQADGPMRLIVKIARHSVRSRVAGLR